MVDKTNIEEAISEEELTSLTRDYAFKRFFSKKGNEKFLKDFLEGLFNIKINNIQVIPEAKLIQRFEKDKSGSMDLRVTINSDIVVDIEMQRKKQNFTDKRSVFYAGRIVSEELEQTESYEDIRNIVMVNILDYPYINLPQYVTETVIVDKNNREYEVIKNIKFFFIELPKFRKSKKDINDRVTQWLSLIDGTDKEMIELAKQKSKIIKEAYGEWEYLTGSAARKRLAELKLKWQLDYNSQMRYVRKEGMEEGLSKGLEQGAKNNKIEIAKKMLEKGEKMDYIIEITGLSKEEIEEL